MASEFEISSAAGAIYAESLLALAEKAGQADAIGAELADLHDLWHREAGFASMMSSAAIDEDARRESIRRIFTGKVSPLVLNLLLVLNDRRRAMILPHVCEAYRKKLDVAMDRTVVRVASAVALDDSQRQRLLAEVKRLTGLAGRLVERVDPKLMAGLSFNVGDRIYDFSTRRRIANLRKGLAESVQRTLLGGAARFVTEG